MKKHKGAPDKKKLRYEQRLIKRCVKNDKQAWEELVETYKGLIYSAILRTMYSVGCDNIEEAAGDIFQDVFALLLKNKCAKLRSFKWKNGCSIAVWLHIIAKNLTFDYLRKKFSYKKLVASFSKDNDKTEDTAAEEINAGEEKLKLFEKALKSLAADDIYFVELLYYRGLKLNQIAALLGKTIDAVYMQKKRITDKLKKSVAGYGG